MHTIVAVFLCGLWDVESIFQLYLIIIVIIITIAKMCLQDKEYPRKKVCFLATLPSVKQKVSYAYRY